MPVRRKDVEGQPDNGGQFAGKRNSPPDFALDAAAHPWTTVDGHDVTEDDKATIGASWAVCACGNNSNREGFVLTDEAGNFRDWSDPYEGLICLVCGRFYHDGVNAYGAREVLPVARFDVEADPFQEAYDAYWHRNNGIEPPQAPEPAGEGTADPNWAYNVLPLDNAAPATIDYDGWVECNCGNSTNGDGFLTTDDRGALHDDYNSGTGLICHACGNFYPYDPNGRGTHQVAPTGRIAIRSKQFIADAEAQWERLNDDDYE